VVIALERDIEDPWLECSISAFVLRFMPNSPEHAEAIAVVAYFDRMRLRRTFTGVIKCKIARGTLGHSVFGALQLANS
jgi:hypothetical protein